MLYILGHGLGRNEQGIVKPLKASLKSGRGGVRPFPFSFNRFLQYLYVRSFIFNPKCLKVPCILILLEMGGCCNNYNKYILTKSWELGLVNTN